MSTLARDSELLSNVGDRPSLSYHSLNEQTSAMQVQTGISVGHEDLLGCEDVRHLH